MTSLGSIWRIPGGGRLADACYFLIRLTGWIGTNLALVVAFYALFFLMLGRFQFEGFVVHLDNFSDRYLHADALRRSLFEWQLFGATALLFAVLSAMRWRTLLFDPSAKENDYARTSRAG